MNDYAKSLLLKLLRSGEKEKVGSRRRIATLTANDLREYLSTDRLTFREACETFFKAAYSQGAIELQYNRDDFIIRIVIIDLEKLSSFLNEPYFENTLSYAQELLRSHITAHPVLQDVLKQWQGLKKVRGLGAETVQDWLDAITVVSTFNQIHVKNTTSMPIREASGKLFKDTKRIERLATPVDVLLTQSCLAKNRDTSEIWQELGLHREEQPVLLAGNIIIERQRVTSVLDKPYTGFHTNTVLRLKQAPEFVLSIENLTTFHTEAKKLMEEPVLLLYTAGMPSPAWRAMYQRLLTSLNTTVPLYHWGDIDEGGFRIAAKLAQTARDVGHTLLPKLMHPSEFPAEYGKPATEYTLQKILYFANLAGWSDLGHDVVKLGLTFEQEVSN